MLLPQDKCVCGVGGEEFVIRTAELPGWRCSIFTVQNDINLEQAKTKGEAYCGSLTNWWAVVSCIIHNIIQ